ncbi:MAG: stage II sporulation protein D [Clostridiales bacterium]|nr:stage II sporulation protein D [Clostridiales bacterium]
MKRVIWASILLAMAAIIMPLMFLRENVNGEDLLEELSPSGQAESNSPEPSETSAKQHYERIPDKDIKFSVSENGEAREVTMADYLPYALAAEMPANFSEEALKAQAVAARTYILYCTLHENPKHPQADICTEAGCCLAYADESKLRGSWGKNFDSNIEIIRKAVTETDGQVMVYDELPILASFHSSSAGKTESGSELWGNVPYLVSVNSPETEKDVPNFVTTVEVSIDNFRETVLSYKTDAVFSENAAEWVKDTELDESGRVRSIIIGGVKLSGSEMRKLFSLRSTAFMLEFKDNIFLFTVTGYGHGLGMSQYGANVMAKNGFNYQEILEHYYPQTKLC